METKEAKSQVTFTIDGQLLTVPKGTTVYEATKLIGIEIPIFCYQDRMPPFGACRVCLVQVEKMPKLQTSCTLVATEGMVVNTQSKMAVEGRKGILEFLLINHPLDCPICDRGGECPLQDQVIEFGPGESRFYEEKRRFTKPLPLGPVLMLDRERCISCARCVRFGDIISGDHALEFVERGYKTEIGTPGGFAAESKYIGNTIMICPVGALTSQVYRFRARPWDNQATSSTCTLCPVGCSMILDSRDGEIVRTRSIENRELNDIWLCDKGWFGYEFSASSKRLTTPLIRQNGKLVPATWDEAISVIAKKIKSAKPNGRIAAFGGNPLTIEENYLFQKLMRDGGGSSHLDHRIGALKIKADEVSLQAGMEITLGECEALSDVFLLGVDLTEEFPLIWLRLKQAINKGAGALFLGHFAPEISPCLSKTILHPPGRELDALKTHLSKLASLASDGKKIALFVGSQYLNSPARAAILSFLSELRHSVSGVSLNILEGSGNSLGACLSGMLPDRGALNEIVSTPGLNADEVLNEAVENGWDYLHVAGANPALKYPSCLWEKARAKLGFLVVQDLFLTETAKGADVVLPALSFVEKQGSFLNIQGDFQQLLPGKDIPKNCLSDAEIFKRIAYQLNIILPIDKTLQELLRKGRLFIDRKPIGLIDYVSCELDRNSLYATFAKTLFDHGIRMQHNTKLVEMAKKPRVRIHTSEAKKRGLSHGDTVVLSANGQSIRALVATDAKVSENTIVIPLGFPELPAHQWGPSLVNGLKVSICKENEEGSYV